MEDYAHSFVEALLKDDKNYVVIFPNNDLGSQQVLDEIKRLENLDKIKIYPSLRFEYFLVLLKNSKYIVGNSSAGIREASYYGIPSVDIGSRQSNRGQGESIFHANNESKFIADAIKLAKDYKKNNSYQRSDFGQGNSDEIFLKLLNGDEIWALKYQKQFQDINYEQN